MYGVSVEGSFSAAHSVDIGCGKFEDMHGHNWKVLVTVEALGLNSNGMIIDFNVVKAALDETLCILDHKNLNEIDFFVENNPTSENISKFLHDSIDEKLRPESKNLVLSEVRVWETELNSAYYKKP
ncbi:MAG: 6-carboxytetrahydropterin synthase [Candidatus Aureabacteria bacterium]|nr:6-carboxytetrahydropterin synthase [Candidatus Auribacterota bacterium]